MPDTVVNPLPNPLVDAYVTAHGGLPKSPSAFARDLIKEYARQHWSLELDPDAVCLVTLQFNPAPAQSPYPAMVSHALSLTQVVLNHYQRRLNWLNGAGYLQPWKPGGLEFRLVDQLLPNFTVHLYEGLFQRSTPLYFDASTHINIQPAALKRFISGIDVRAGYQRYLEHFLAAYGESFSALAKASFIKAAFLQLSEKSLSQADYQLALNAAGLGAAQRWETLAPTQLHEAVTPPSHIVVAPLKVHRYTATDILVIKDTHSGRALLYIPGNSSPLHGFTSEHQLVQWLATECREPGKRLALAVHFQERDHSDGLFLSGLHTALEGIAAWPHWLNRATGSWPPRHYLHGGKRISGDPFIHLATSLQARLRADARSVIHTKGEAGLEDFAEGLSRSLVFTGLVALIAPEAVPFIIGLSITLIGVGSAQEAQAKTFEARIHAAHRIEFGLFNALPLAAEGIVKFAIAEGGAAAESGEGLIEPEQVAEHGSQIKSTPAPARRFAFAPPNLRALTPDLRQSLRRFEAAPESVQGQPTIHGPNGMLDIYHTDGHYFIWLHDKPYEVCWEDPARRWRITSPDGKGKPGPFIKQLETDQWDIDLPGLKGGMEGISGAVTTPSSAPALSMHAQVEALYPGFTPRQTAAFLAELRANGTSIEIQLGRLSMDYQSLERSLERWVGGPMSWRAVTDTHSVPVSSAARRQAAEIIKRCWQRQTPVAGAMARNLGGYTLDLSGLVIGDLPYLPGDFSHVTALNLSRTYVSQQTVSALVGKCPQLRWLNAENNFLAVVPAGIRQLRHLTRLTLANNRIVLTPDMLQTLRRLPNLRLLNLERNPIGPSLDVSEMPQLLNLFLRATGIEQAPAGVFELPNLIALDLRSNRISTLPEEFFQMPGAVRHTLLDGNPLSVATRGRIASLGGPLIAAEQADNVEFWLYQTPALQRMHRRALWDVFWSELHAADFFEVIARLQNSADFSLSRDAVTQRVWDLLEAGGSDAALRSRLISMAAFPETCVDGVTVIFSNMELEVLVSRARTMARAGGEGQALLKLIRGLYRLEEVDAIARLDIEARVGFTEDVEVLLAYRVGLAARLDLPVSTRTMQFSGFAGVSNKALDKAAQTILGNETAQGLTSFALKRDFWTNHLRQQYADQFLICQKPTAMRMEALDDLHSARPLSDATYKREAEAIMAQRQLDEERLMTQLTQAELAGRAGANEV